MKPLIKSISAITLFLVLVLFSCNKDDPEAKAAAKEIQSFTFAALSPAVTAVIDASAKTIRAEVPAGTDLTTLVPTIAVSEKAALSPATGTSQDFSKPVMYTVTAEDGTSDRYTATITIQNNGTVFVGNLDGDFYALDALTGTKKWSFKAGGSINGTPTVGSGVVYFASWDKKLYALDAATGAKKWEARTEAGNLIFSGAVVSSGLVYIGIGRKMYAFDAATGSKKWEYETSRGIDQSSPCVLDKNGTAWHAGISGMVQ